VQVTIVAVLQRLGANEDLFALVFGESCLNDAVGIVLYRTMSMFLHRRVSAGSIVMAFFSFIGVFLGSVLIGRWCLATNDICCCRRRRCYWQQLQVGDGALG
jgi:NhaP-type Na+/H+ or K+/H+ antiporter